MNDWIDIHSHLLPGADDGVATVEDSLACLRAARDAGFSDVILTRHRIKGLYDLPADQAEERRAMLRDAALAAGIRIKLHGGAEHYLDEDFLANLESGAETLAGGKALLFEAPMTRIPPTISDIAFRIRLKGYVPILAHVERYREVAERPARAAELSEAGLFLQLNLGSLGGLYGRSVMKAARYLLEHGMIFCAAGDVHGLRWVEPSWEKGVSELRRIVGDAGLDILLRDNPAKILGVGSWQ